MTLSAFRTPYAGYRTAGRHCFGTSCQYAGRVLGNPRLPGWCGAARFRQHKIVVSVSQVIAEDGDPPINSGLRAGRYATLTIADNGEGMAEATRQRIFEPFFLRRLGYEVMTAASPAEAIEIASSDPTKIRALITDVVMPSMNGAVLSDRIYALHPGIETLFMSGYSLNVIERHGLNGKDLILKPFTCREVATRLRCLLDRKNNIAKMARS